MVGQGVLRECLLDAQVESVLLVGRSSSGRTEPKVSEAVHSNLADLTPIEGQLQGYDACFFCLGVSSAGMSEADYRRVTYDLTTSVATRLAKLNPAMTFIYVSGAGTDSSEQGRLAWARVKGATENALLRMPFKAAYMFRPGFIRPMNGEKPKATSIRIALAALGFLFPLIGRLAPNYMTTTERMGRAMINAARFGSDKPILEAVDINAIAARN